MSKELKPCPFCGSQATLINFGVWDYPDDTAADERVAMCSNTHCGVETELVMWNTRPIEDVLTAEVEGLNSRPTEEAYLAACAARTKWQGKAEQAEAKAKICEAHALNAIKDLEKAEAKNARLTAEVEYYKTGAHYVALKKSEAEAKRLQEACYAWQALVEKSEAENARLKALKETTK